MENRTVERGPTGKDDLAAMTGSLGFCIEWSEAGRVEIFCARLFWTSMEMLLLTRERGTSRLPGIPP